MALRDEWKQTGKGLGRAFKDLGLQISKSAMVGVGKAAELVQEGSDSLNREPEEKPEEKQEEKSEKPIIDADE